MLLGILTALAVFGAIWLVSALVDAGAWLIRTADSFLIGDHPECLDRLADAMERR